MQANYSSPQLGGLGVEPFLPLARIPEVIAEWAALIPLVCHLASHRYDYQLAGEASLTGRFSLGLFPRLGVSSAIGRFLEEGPDFVERTAAMGGVGSRSVGRELGQHVPVRERSGVCHHHRVCTKTGARRHQDASVAQAKGERKQWK